MIRTLVLLWSGLAGLTRTHVNKLAGLGSSVFLCGAILCFGPQAGSCRADEPTEVDNTPPRVALGLEERTLWATSQIRGFPDPPPPLKLVRAFPQVNIPNLIALSAIPESDYLLAIDHRTDWGGPSRIVQFQETHPETAGELFLERPEIIYGLAFHPDFASNRYVFVGCNGHSEKLDQIATRVLRFQVRGQGPFTCDPDSVEVILEWKSNGHNGGDLVFASDGSLFVSAGDGSSDSDRDRTGQDLSTLAGSLLRINVDVSQGQRFYTVPADNPFLNVPGARPEIWAYGLRNPWRVTFDAKSQQLWVGNNGQDLWESVYLIQRGANYGWSINEANHPFHTEQTHGPVEISPATAEHPHSEARSLTGGHVYRGVQFPFLKGAYVYGDYSTGNVWAIRMENGQQTMHQKLARSQLQITGFGVDQQGELLVADHQGGIYRFEWNDSQQDTTFPKQLSQTGLFRSVADEEPMPGLLAYDVNSPLWSDGAVKRRWMAVPNELTVDYKPKGSWEFPEGSVLVKSFAFPSVADGKLRRIETRLFAKQQGEWFGYSYRWNREQTDAYLVEAAGRVEVIEGVAAQGHDGDSVTWRYPSRSECMVCHSRAANYVLGLSGEQMNRWHDYSAGEVAVRAPQLETLQHIGLFGSGDITTPSETLVDPSDSSQSLERRVRSYLHANCSSCHVKEGGGNSKIVLSYFGALESMNLIEAQPLHGKLGLSQATLVQPGAPERSILLKRISQRGPGQMPPLATRCVDPQAVELLSEWIVSLADATDKGP